MTDLDRLSQDIEDIGELVSVINAYLVAVHGRDYRAFLQLALSVEPEEEDSDD